MTYEEFLNLSIIKDSFPLKYLSGTQYKKFTIYCNDCKKEILQDNIRGLVYKRIIGNYRDSAFEYYIVAHGLCLNCNKLSTLECTIRDNFSITSHHYTGDIEFSLKEKSQNKIVLWFKNIFKRIHI